MFNNKLSIFVKNIFIILLIAINLLVLCAFTSLGTIKKILIEKNESYYFTKKDFDSIFGKNNFISAIRIIKLPGSGYLTYQKIPVLNQQIIDSKFINQLVFTPAFNESGEDYAFIKFKVQDSHLTWSQSYTLIISVSVIIKPRIIISGYLDHFCGVKVGNISDEKTYSVGGTNLLSGIEIKPAQDFEISTTSGTGFITFPQTLILERIQASVPETQLYVRYKPSTGTIKYTPKYIAHTSMGAATKRMLVSGSGIFMRTIVLNAPTPADDFPVMVILNKKTFDYSHVLPNGADIRFMKEGNIFQYWIQTWNPEGESIIWVRILNARTSSFDMAYGTSNLAPISNESDNDAVDWIYTQKNLSIKIISRLSSECNSQGGGVWLGVKSEDWFDPENWNSGGIPKISDNVIIDEMRLICHD